MPNAPSIHAPSARVERATDRFRGSRAPLRVDAARVAPIWHRLADRARRLSLRDPPTPPTDDPELRARTEGAPLPPALAARKQAAIALRAGARSVRPMSRAAPPTAGRDDGRWRRTG
jgi:hypothetical protein